LIDIMATCVEVSGAAYPRTYQGQAIKPLEGVSLVPVFAGKPIQRTALFWEHERNCAIRQGKWKLVGKGILGPDGPALDKWELYDIEADRSELNDLASRDLDRVRAMAATYLEYCHRANVLPLGGK
jgi:arylsulfatase